MMYPSGAGMHFGTNARTVALRGSYLLTWGLMPVQKRSSIFVVDDDASIRCSIERLLRTHGVDAKLFDSSEALFDHDDFSTALCIIIDIDLNGQSGIELRRSLTEQGIAAPVIFITGNDSETNRSAAIESGCIAYLNKPFTAQSIFEAVARARASV